MTSACAVTGAAGGRIYVPGVGPCRAAAAADGAGAATMVSGAVGSASLPWFGTELLGPRSLAVGVCARWGQGGSGWHYGAL